MRRLAPLAVALLAALAVPATAAAHATLDSAYPETQSRIDAPPKEIRLAFSQVVTATSSAILVLAADGRVVSGEARVSDDGRVVTAPVSGLRRGEAYTVRWRVTGPDGHSPAGVYTFGVGVAAPPPTEAVGAGATTWKDDAARWLLFAALALVIGPLAIRLLVVRGPVPDRLERRFHVVATVAAFAVVDVGIVAFVLRAANALQLPVVDLLYGDLTPFAEKTRFGIAFLAMTLGFAAVAALLMLAWIFDWLVLRWPAFLLAAVLVSGLSVVRLPSVSDLWETEYGNVLLLKVGIVAVALAWGGVHHAFVRPRLEAGGQPRVRASLVGESAVALAVLLAAAVLTNVSPPEVGSGPTPAVQSGR